MVDEESRCESRWLETEAVIGGLCAGVYLSVGSQVKYLTIFETDTTILKC